MKLTDLKDLRVIKKDLSPEPEDKPQQNQPRKRSVELRSKEEEHARNEGLVMGQKVRMMDTNDTATITGFGKGYYELELDGLTIRAVRSEFIPVDPDDDRKLRASIPSRVKKQEDCFHPRGRGWHTCRRYPKRAGRSLCHQLELYVRSHGSYQRYYPLIENRAQHSGKKAGFKTVLAGTTDVD